jgi:hypothetical protein
LQKLPKKSNLLNENAHILKSLKLFLRYRPIVRPFEIATMGQKYEFLAKIFFLQKWIFIVAFDRISLVLNVFIKNLVK